MTAPSSPAPDDPPELTIPEPVEPILAGDERTMLIGFLDFYRTVLLRKADGMTAEQLGRRTAASTLTLGRIVRHMTFVEDHWFQHVLAGAAPIEPWGSAPWGDDPDWEMTTADGMSWPELRTDFEAACIRTRATLSHHHALDLIAPGAHPDRLVSMRWILIHMIEEYARHAGHADLLRETIDGRVGD